MTSLELSFLDVVSPAFAKIYFDEFDRPGNQYTEICNVMDSSSYQEKLSEVGGVGAWAATNADASASFEDPRQLYDTTITHTTYSKGVRIQRELWDDDLFGVMKKIPKSMGYGAKAVIEQAVANMYNRAFTGYTKADGKNICDNSHPIADGGTEDNLNGTADLAASTLKDANLLMRATTDDKGLLLALRAKKLLIKPDEEYNAIQLLKSTLEPETGDNAVNPHKGSMKLVVNDYLTDADAWFILTAASPIDFFWREKPIFDTYVDKDTRAAKFNGFMRASVDAPRWRGIVGTAGAS